MWESNDKIRRVGHLFFDFTYNEAANLQQNYSDNVTPPFWVDQTPEIENVDQSELIH